MGTVSEVDDAGREKEIMEGNVFSIFTVVDAVEVLFEVSVDSAQRVVEPFDVELVFHAMEYKVPDAVEVEPMSVELAKVPP